MNESQQLLSLIRELITEIVILEKTKRSKPGGPLTKLGALKKLHPGEFAINVKGAVDSAKGSVADAAQNLGVADRTLYHYLDTIPTLSRVKTTEDREKEKEEKRKSDERKRLKKSQTK